VLLPEPASAQRARGGLGAGLHVELAQDVPDMCFDRGLLNAQQLRDLRVRGAGGQEVQDFPFPAGQRLVGGVVNALTTLVRTSPVRGCSARTEDADDAFS
jgi:hypothetical protein